MQHDAQVTLVGNATRDPELRFTPAGDAVANLSIAINNQKQNAQKEWIDGPPTFIEVTCWRGLAEHVAETVSKGHRLILIGRLETESWEDKQGNERSTLRLQAVDVGPSLLWSTATVTKAESTGPRQPTRTPARSGSSSRGGGFTKPGGGFTKPGGGTQVPYDEEPFVMDSFEGEDYFDLGTRRYVP